MAEAAVLFVVNTSAAAWNVYMGRWPWAVSFLAFGAYWATRLWMQS